MAGRLIAAFAFVLLHQLRKFPAFHFDSSGEFAPLATGQTNSSRAVCMRQILEFPVQDQSTFKHNFIAIIDNMLESHHSLVEKVSPCAVRG